MRPVISAKLSPPRLSPDHLRRDRLDRRWAELLKRRVLFVVAGAGFGKTSFLADWVSRETRPVGWYTLDESDSDPEVFLAHLACAVCGAIGWDTQDVPGSDVNAIVQLLYASETPPLLVFDDLHTLRPGSRTLGHVSRVLRYLPEGGSVVLASREPPAVERARWEVRGDVGELVASDLAFDADEIVQLLSRRFPGCRIGSGTIARIAEQTEGWAAGLELLIQRIDDPDPGEIERVLDVMSSAGSGWFGYFAEEVVSRLEPRLQKFLRQTCYLPRLIPEVCDRVLGTDESALLLEELHTRNLFTFGTHDDDSVYRYHPLFRSYLQRTARQSVSENELRSTRRKSARALLEIGYVADALTELIDVGDRKSALRLVRRRAVQLLEEGALDGLRPILERLTVTELDSSPEALALIGTSWDYEGDWDRASSFYRRALKGAPRASVRAELLSRLASLEQRRGRNKTAIRLCKSGLRSESRLSSPLRTRLLSTLGIACCDSGRLIHGEEYFNQALEIAARTGSARVSARILFLLAANVHYPRGDFLRAREAAHRSHLLFQELEHSFQVCHSLGVLAFVTMEGGDIDGARPLAHRALRIAKSLEYESVVGYCEYTVGKIDLLSGDRSEARRLFESSLERGGRTGESHLQVLPKLGLAHLDLMEGNVLRARKFGEEALSTAEELQDRLGQIQAHQLLARVEAGRDSIRVRSHWDAAESLAERLGARAELHRVWIDRLLGEGKRDVANDPGTRDRLAGLVRGIAESGHEFLLAQVAEERVESLLSMARQLGVEERYVESLSHRLGRATTAEGAGDPPPRCAPDVDGASPGCEFEIQALGSLRVRVGSRWIERDDWRSARARKLFLSLLAHRFRWVTKPQLIELLWPGADPGRGENSLRQSVHVLRRLLDSPGSERSSFVLVQADACRLDPGPSFRYDVSEFESFVAAGESSWDPDEPGEAESKFRRALELLRGDFVEDSPYEEGLASERERLRELAVRTHLRVIEAASGSGEWAEVVALSRRGLELDPYHEDLHAFVIEGLTQIGHRKEAVLAYQEYESRMSREMRLLPSRRLVALAERAGVLAHPSSRGRDE